MTQSNEGLDPTKNAFSAFPPILPMVVIAVVLVAMAQFGSTERLAAAFAWLIFVAVLLADGIPAFEKLNNGTSAGASAMQPPAPDSRQAGTTM